MAAVICSTIGELCSGLGRVVCLPCKACGIGCDALGDVIKSPFMPYILLTFGLNMPSLVYGAKSAILDCGELTSWMLANGAFAIAHMIACMYVVGKIREPRESETALAVANDVEAGKNYNNFSVPQREEHGAANSCARIKHVMCYDKKMAVYIVIAILWVCWQAVGVGRRFGFSEGNDCDEVGNYMGIVIGLGYMYMCMVGIAFACSLCCLR